MRDRHEEIARALLGLTSRERAVAVMREVYGMTDEEIEPLVGRIACKGDLPRREPSGGISGEPDGDDATFSP